VHRIGFHSAGRNWEIFYFLFRVEIFLQLVLVVVSGDIASGPSLNLEALTRLHPLDDNYTTRKPFYDVSVIWGYVD
jgi:hypothetical protein